MSDVRFIDANVFLRHILRDDEEKAARAWELFEELRLGKRQAVTNSLVIFEIVFTLHRSYRYPKADIQLAILMILRLKGLRVPEAVLIEAALQLFMEHNISYGDAYSAIWMRERGISDVYSWDTEFNRVPWLERIEP